VQAPVKPAKTDPGSATGVSVTGVLPMKSWKQRPGSTTRVAASRNRSTLVFTSGRGGGRYLRNFSFVTIPARWARNRTAVISVPSP